MAAKIADKRFQEMTPLYCVSEDKLGVIRGRSRTAATSKMERFVITVNGWKPLTINTKRSILDAAVVLDPPPSDS